MRTLTHRALEGRRILVLEDSFLIAVELEIILSREGANVLLADSEAKAALVLKGEEAVDFGVLDIRLRGEDSFETAKNLIQMDVPFVFHSGHGSMELFGERFPGVAFLSKPASPDQLVRAALEATQR